MTPQPPPRPNRWYNVVLALANSRKFMLVVLGWGFTLFCYFLGIPWPVWAAAVALVGVCILGIAVEDAAEKWRRQHVEFDEAVYRWLRAETERREGIKGNGND